MMDTELLLFIVFVVLVALFYIWIYWYKLVTGKSEFWKFFRKEQNLNSAFSQGDFKTFQKMSELNRAKDEAEQNDQSS